MTKTELIRKLDSLEWEDFEVKAANSALPKSVWETVSAFSNTSGGWLILGVSQNGDKFTITGVGNVEKLEQDFLNTLRATKFNEFIETKQEMFSFDGKVVLAFYIPIHKNKPIYYNNQSNTFIRRGSSDHRATQQEIDSMLRDRAFGTKTSELAKGTNTDSLNNSSLQRYRDYMSRFNSGASYNRYSDDEFLNKLRIIDANGQCTYAGLLMFGKREEIERFFPDFRIDLLEMPPHLFGHPRYRYTFRLDEHENLWEYYFECFARLKRKVDVKFVLTSEGFGQELSPGLESIREALVNMLIHTDYFSPACPRIRIYERRIEFFNPGGLPKPFKEIKYKDISLPRNPILAKLFRMVKLAENAGFGFDKMDYNWKVYTSEFPKYEIEFDSVFITFDIHNYGMLNEPSPSITPTTKVKKSYTPTVKKYGTTPIDVIDKTVYVIDKPTDTIYKSTDIVDKSVEVSISAVDKIIELIGNKPSITSRELQELTKLSRRGVEYHLDKLKKAGKLKRVGANKGGYWELTI